jgi:hypothetical protein
VRASRLTTEKAQAKQEFYSRAAHDRDAENELAHYTLAALDELRAATESLG